MKMFNRNNFIKTLIILSLILMISIIFTACNKDIDIEKYKENKIEELATYKEEDIKEYEDIEELIEIINKAKDEGKERIEALNNKEEIDNELIQTKEIIDSIINECLFSNLETIEDLEKYKKSTIIQLHNYINTEYKTLQKFEEWQDILTILNDSKKNIIASTTRENVKTIYNSVKEEIARIKVSITHFCTLQEAYYMDMLSLGDLEVIADCLNNNKKPQDQLDKDIEDRIKEDEVKRIININENNIVEVKKDCIFVDKYFGTYNGNVVLSLDSIYYSNTTKEENINIEGVVFNYSNVNHIVLWISKEEIESYKYDKIKNLDIYVKSKWDVLYTEEDWQLIQDIELESINNIEKALYKTNVNEIYNNAITSIENINIQKVEGSIDFKQLNSDIMFNFIEDTNVIYYVIIRSQEDLEQFLLEYIKHLEYINEIMLPYILEEKELILEKYDENYFKEKALLLYLETVSTVPCYIWRVNGLKIIDGEIIVYTTQIQYTNIAFDMVSHSTFLVEVNKADIQDITSFKIQIKYERLINIKVE